MKRINFIIVLFMIFFTTNVYAASFSTTISGDSKITPGSEFTINVGVSGADNLWGFKAPISYDSSKITLKNSSGSNGFGIAIGTNFVADAGSGKNGSVNVAVLTFKATENFKEGEKTTISLGTAEGSDGENIMEGSGSSHSVSMTAPLSSNNTLSSLTISPQNIQFNKNTKTYNITVENDVTSIKISATKEHDKATLSGTGNKELKLYTNTFYVVVTAENGSKNTYTINVVRKDEKGNVKELSANNKLKELAIKDYQILFSPDILEYTILLNKDIKDTDISAIVEDETATVTVNMPEVIEKGNNEIIISVIAENGDEIKYKINAVSLEEKVVEQPKVEEKNVSYALPIISTVITTLVLESIAFLVLIKKNKIMLNLKKN